MLWRTIKLVVSIFTALALLATAYVGSDYADLVDGVPVGVVTTVARLLGYTCAPAWALGFRGDGVTPNNGAWLNWASGTPSQACLQFGPGKFKFSTSISYTLSGTPASITIEGAGADNTILYFPSSAVSGVSATFDL